jgi:Recombination endonuclease VII
VKRYWSCPCGTRNERIKQRCESCRRARPKRRVPKHAHTLRDDGYAVYVEVNALIHGVTDEACGVCGKPRAQERRHDRDHDHSTGQPRGLACVYCNKHMPRGLTLDLARLVVEYLERVEAYYKVAA